MKDLLTALGALVLFPLLLLYTCFSWGLVAFKFYFWFVLPVYSTLPTITFLQAIGLMFFIGLFRGVQYQQVKEEYRNKSTEYITSFIAPWLSLLFGWLFKVLFM